MKQKLRKNTSILSVCYYDNQGGAARAAYRLHSGLTQKGFDAKLIVHQKVTNDPSVHQISSAVNSWIPNLTNYGKIDRLPLRLYPKRSIINWSSNWVPSQISQAVNKFEADIVHLHWVGNGMLPVKDLKKINAPIVWTLHDMWPFTGGCHYDEECGRFTDSCGRCPMLGSNKQYDLSHRVLQRKNNNWRDLNITIVAPSRWLANCAAKSSLFRNNRIEVIPYGLDLNLYQPKPKVEAKDKLKIPGHHKVILFGAATGTKDPRKGFHKFVEALNHLPKEAYEDWTVVVFGPKPETEVLNIPIKFQFTGHIQDETKLAEVYSAADVFVIPSLQDNLPNTVLEALACGTPCVGFETGGLPDMIDHTINGYLAEPFKASDLAKGIQFILDEARDWKSLSDAAREKANSHYQLKQQAEAYIQLYDELLLT